MNPFPRITIDPDKLCGQPCIRGLRISVATVLNMLGAGMSEEELLADYPYLESEDIRECLRFAAALADEQGQPLADAGAA